MVAGWRPGSVCVSVICHPAAVTADMSHASTLCSLTAFPVHWLYTVPGGPSWHFFLHSLLRLKAPQIKPETQALFVLADSLTRRSTWVVSGGSYDTLFIQLQKAEAGDESTRVSEDINLRTPHHRARASRCTYRPLHVKYFHLEASERKSLSSSDFLSVRQASFFFLSPFLIP